MEAPELAAQETWYAPVTVLAGTETPAGGGGGSKQPFAPAVQPLEPEALTARAR